MRKEERKFQEFKIPGVETHVETESRSLGEAGAEGMGGQGCVQVVSQRMGGRHSI